jgi:hypothetical protein
MAFAGEDETALREVLSSFRIVTGVALGAKNAFRVRGSG